MRPRHDALTEAQMRDELAAVAAILINPGRDPNAWADKAAPGFTMSLHGIPGSRVVEALHRWSDTERSLPKPVDIRGLIQAAPGSMPSGCEDCRGAGVREIAWHRYELDMNGNPTDRVHVTVYAAKCSCPMGGRMLGATQQVDQLMDLLTSRPHHVAAYATGRDHPLLSTVERLGADVCAAIAESPVTR